MILDKNNLEIETGEIKAGVFNGTGIYKYANGDVYTGSF